MAAATHGAIRHVTNEAELSSDDAAGSVGSSPGAQDPYDSADSAVVDAGDLAGDRLDAPSKEEAEAAAAEARALQHRAEALSSMDDAVASAGVQVDAPQLEGRATAKRTAEHEASTISAALSAVTAGRGSATGGQLSGREGERIGFKPSRSRQSMPPGSVGLKLAPDAPPAPASKAAGGQGTPAGGEEADAKAGHKVTLEMPPAAKTGMQRVGSVKLRSPKHDSDDMWDEDEDFSEVQRKPWTRWGCVRGTWCILHPHSHVKSAWDIFMLPAIFYTATVMPYTLSFEVANEGLEVTDWVVYSMFAVDMLVQFLSAYVDKAGHVISDPWAIAMNYMSGWFLMDFISIFPFNTILGGGDASGGGQRLARLARLPRALRMVRVVKVGRLMQLPVLMNVWHSLEDTFLSLPAFASVLRTLGISVLFAHWIACFWHWIGITPANGGDIALLQDHESWIAAAGYGERSLFDRYIASVYWVLVTMSTVGYGDIGPVTTGEQGFAMLVMVIGMLGGGILVADILQVVAAQAKSSNSQRKREDGVSHLLRSVAPPKPLRRRLHRWLEDSNKSAEAVSDILPQLPSALRRDVLLYARSGLIDNIHFLRELRDNDTAVNGADVVADVVWKLERTTASPGGVLYVQTTPVHGMLFLSKGLVALLRDGQQVAEMSAGSFFGAAECLFSDTYESTATAMADTEAYILPRQAVYDLTQKYPMLFGVPLREVALQRMDAFGYTDVADPTASSGGSYAGGGPMLHGAAAAPGAAHMAGQAPGLMRLHRPSIAMGGVMVRGVPPPAPPRPAHPGTQEDSGGRPKRGSLGQGAPGLSGSAVMSRLAPDVASSAASRAAQDQDNTARVLAAMHLGARATVLEGVSEEGEEEETPLVVSRASSGSEEH